MDTKFFERELADHPDQSYANGIINIARYGFKYGMIQDDKKLNKLPKYVRNLTSPYENMTAVDEILCKELPSGRIFCYDDYPIKNQIKLE